MAQAEEGKVAFLHAFFRKEGGSKALVQELARKGLQRLPPAYVLPAYQQPGLSHSSSVRPPTVDLAYLHEGAHGGRPACLAALARACEEWGIIQVISLSLSLSLSIEELAITVHAKVHSNQLRGSRSPADSGELCELVRIIPLEAPNLQI
ncbi:hypothetical protein L7F22_024280 [Adiantum nelumboides]|nr:hypothetical protein [Adiantum nelumboides]